MSPDSWSAEDYDRQAQRRYEAGAYDEALKILERGATLYPAAAELKVSIGYTQLAREEYAWARRAFVEALAADPNHEDALVGLGEALLKLGERARGLHAFERVIDLGFGAELDLMLSIGRALYREELFAYAERFFRCAVEANPDSAEAATDLAYALRRQGDAEGARHWLEKSLQLDPHSHDSRSLLASILCETGEREGAPPEHEGAGAATPEVESSQPPARDATPSRLQVDLSRAEAPVGLASGAGARLTDGTWARIVAAMCESSGDPDRSIGQFMRETARRIREQTGIQIPDDDPEAFLRASVAAGGQRTER